MKIFWASTIVFLVLFGVTNFALATVYPAANADIMLKKTPAGLVKIFPADKNGIFRATGLPDGTYDIFLYDQAQPAIVKAVPAKNGAITGRIMFQIKDGNSKDTESLVPKAMNTFQSNVWDQSHLSKLRQILQKEDALPQVLEAKQANGKITDLKDALKKFQKKYALTANGTADTATLKKLNAIVDDDAMWSGN